MVAPEWFRGFFDDTYLEILKAQGGTKRTRAEVDFLVKALRLKLGARVLDVPCGFGRHSGELARRGYSVVGVDLSPTMLREARRRHREGERLRFVRHDMRRLSYQGEFDAVVCLFTSFGYFSERENVATLKKMARALKPDGRLLIDHRNPYWDARLPTRRWDRETSRIFVLSNLCFNRRTGVHENTWLILRLGDRQIVRKALRVRLWTRRQWERRLRAAGARLVRAYAGLDGRPYRRASGRLIVLAEKR
jgi:SAM-dependent methyltransferase